MNFTLPDQGTDEATDSDADAFGFSGTIPLTAEAAVNLLVGAGLVRQPGPPDGRTTPMVFTYANGSVVGANGLKVAKWGSNIAATNTWVPSF